MFLILFFLVDMASTIIKVSFEKGFSILDLKMKNPTFQKQICVFIYVLIAA
jgi:hypothetical protein